MLHLKFDDRFGILVQFPLRIHVLNCSVTYRFYAMGIFEKALHSKIEVFVKFESAINLEIRGHIKKKNWIIFIWVTGTICKYFHQNLGRSRLILHFFGVIRGGMTPM